MTFKLKNNYRFLKHKLSAFQWYIVMIWKSWFFVIFIDVRALKMAPDGPWGLKNNYRFFVRFLLYYTRSVDHLYFSWINGNITLAQQLYSVFYKGQKVIGYWFREEHLQIVILFHIGNHIFRHVTTLMPACKPRQS